MKSKLILSILLFAALNVRADLDVDNGSGATLIGAYGATINASVISTGAANPNLVFFWGVSDGGTNTAAWSSSVPMGVVGVGDYSTALIGLAQGQVYYYRALVTNASELAWASASATWTTRMAVVSTRALMVAPDNSIANADDFADVNDLVSRAEALQDYVRRDGSTSATALQVRGDIPGSGILSNSTFDVDTDWSWIGNASWSGSASNTIFAQGGYGRVAYATAVPPGVYALVRTVYGASDTNSLAWSTGLDSGVDLVTSTPATVTNIVRVGGTLAFDATPSAALYLDNVQLLPYAGGDVSGGAGLFESMAVRTRPSVGMDQVALVSDLDAFVPFVADGFLPIAPREIASVVEPPWYSSGSGWTNATGWYTDGTLESGGIKLYPSNVVVSPLLDKGFAELEVQHATSPYGAALVQEVSTNLIEWVTAERTVNQVYVQLALRENLALPDYPLEILVTNLVAYTWKYPEQALKTYDVSGIILEVAPAVGPLEPVRKEQLDEPVAALHVKVDQWSKIPAVSVVRDGGQGYAVGNYWTMSADKTWRLHYGGQTVLSMQSSGAVPPDILDFEVTAEEITLVVRGTQGFEAHPQFSTNAVDWISISTNDFTSTYPDLSDDSYTLTFAPVDATPMWYRAITMLYSGATGLVGIAVLSVDLDMSGNSILNSDNLWQFSTNAPAHSLATAAPRTIATSGTNVWICPADGFYGPGTNWIRITGEIVAP